MLNTKKLLYLLPDVAYVAELLPTKKEHTFTIQNFRQINGEYMDDNAFIAENVVKLFTKLDPEEYFLVLPDFLFTNTILNVEETSDTKIKQYLNSELLPELNLSNDTHQIESFVLTEFKGTAKVQLSAIEKEVLGPIRAAASNAKISIEGVAPLSWTVKSIISLEPSISVLQIGSQLYTAQHYIGIDQTTISEVSEAEAVAETIRTLKGAEPSIQTIYLLVNSVVEEKLIDELSDTVPLQQLASFKEEDSKMPSYVRQTIESGMKTLSIEDYPVPIFKLGTVSSEEKKAYITESVEELEVEDVDENKDELPKPTPVITPVEKPVKKIEPAVEEIEDDDEDEKKEEEIEKPATPLPGAVATVAKEKTEAVAKESVAEVKEAVEEEKEPVEEKETAEKKDVKSKEQPVIAPVTPPDDTDEIDLSQFAQSSQKTTDSPETVKVETKKTVIKNKSGIGNMLKMVFITLAVFAATVAIGIGVGLGLLSVANRDATPEPSPTPTTEVAIPEPTATPDEASPSAETDEINNEDYDLLVVNATTIAGYAGTVKSDLDDAEFGTVTASNATEEYEPGMYVLMEERNNALIEALKEATGLELTFLEDADPAQEDSQGSYDAVVVLAE